MSASAKSSAASKYRVLIGLDYPKSKAIWDRLVGGENIPFDERGEMVRREAGDVVTMPGHVVECFLDMKAIEPVKPAKKEADDGA